MKKLFSLFILFLVVACGQNNRSDSRNEKTDADTASKQAVLPDEPLSYPALYTDWEIGKRTHLDAVLNMYKDWDEETVNKMSEYFADTVALDMPDGKRNSGTKTEVIARMDKFRSEYKNTHNQVLHAIPLLNKGTNVYWVRAMVYNKWTYKDNKKDSLLYYDLWRFKDDKIDYLLSLQQTPSRLEVKQLEKMAEKIN